jgi:hypothetical protein
MFAAQFATAGEPMSLPATLAEQTFPPGPTLTAMVTCPRSEESLASALL